MEERRHAYASVGLSFADYAECATREHHPRAAAVERRHCLYLWHHHRFVSV